jgi:non-specific serine/threonine protein kinase
MSLSKYEILNNFSFKRYTSDAIIQRGTMYFKQNRVQSMDWQTDDIATCEVNGDSGDYLVSIYFEMQSEQVFFECDCPYAEKYLCKHMVAAMLEMQHEFQEEQEIALYPQSSDALGKPPTHLETKRWQRELDNILALKPVPQTSKTSAHFVVVFIFSYRNHSGYSYYTYDAYRISEKMWAPLQDVIHESPTVIHSLLESDTSWFYQKDIVGPNFNAAGCINLNQEAVSLVKLLKNLYRYTGTFETIISYLPVISSLGIPCFLYNEPMQQISRLQIHPDPVNLHINMAIKGENLVLAAEISNIKTADDESKIDVLSRDPAWIRSGNHILQLAQVNDTYLIQKFPLVIANDHIPVFLQTFYLNIAQSFPITGDLAEWQDVHADPTPRLYLFDDTHGKLFASLRFAYGEYIFEAQKSNQPYMIYHEPDSWALKRIHRQPEVENRVYQTLCEPTYQLKKATTEHPYGTLELRSRAHPFDFLLHTVPQLTATGFEIYGEEQLKLGKINRNTPTMRISITSGIDWFDLQTMVVYGDQEVPLPEIRKAAKKGLKFVKLADGSVGEIPESWLEKYKRFWNLANETADGYRVQNFHVSLIDTLLDENQDIEIPLDLAQKREQLSAFTHIEPKEIPQGFIGELRPYQKHGYDWLHFLHEYHFGGILADDMGLGKTIQGLAFLQSLYEARPDLPASLLVVPKSLIVNWQRESENFTPGLRFLEYIGNLRNKDTSIFNQYNIILTTYGTMLRDVALLKTYKFHYIILDESQAIKNPLTKNAKAARLLAAEHRLAMTGTPVENNTFELWSQFAFLNPGLLGNMESFKRDFANPIESGSDEQAVAMLRRLVYPFILRRTKEQVAPELPPRTERVIYTDMEPEQKKLYQQTRERYRKELLGLLDEKGMDDVRFKILEALLRLRQISIHPLLVEKNYTGDAAKFERLFEILETLQVENHKALIFSQFVEVLNLVKQKLDEQHVPYVYLDGATTKRQEQVDIFQNDPKIPFFLISLKAGGVGLNLTAAEYVIHLDPWWNPAVEMQASDRAHRIGQENPVFIYKLITRNTVEEKVLLLQEKKRALVNQLITTESSFFKSLRPEDVSELFA